MILNPQEKQPILVSLLRELRGTNNPKDAVFESRIHPRDEVEKSRVIVVTYTW